MENWDYVYCYPNSSVLKNKFGITDETLLSQAERQISAIAIDKLEEQHIKGNLDLKHLQAIHKYIFSDIYDWAGKLRTVNIFKGCMFYRFDYLDSACATVFDKLKSENYLLDLSQTEMCKRLAYYLGEINVLHPFREGNGRTQRVFMEYLARVGGYDVDFSTVNSKEMINASILAYNCDYTAMEQMFSRIISPISFIEQEKFVYAISKRNSPVLKTFNDTQYSYCVLTPSQVKTLEKKGLYFKTKKKNEGTLIAQFSKKDKSMVEATLNSVLDKNKNLRR